MQRRAKPGKQRLRRKTSVFLAWAALAACAALAGSGCSMTHQATNDKLGDPLLGPAPPPGVQPTPPRGAASAGLPPIPAGGLSTNAALASQSPQGQSLSIGESDGWLRRVDGAATAPGTQKTPVIPTSTPKVVPVPRDEGLTAAPGQPVQPAGSWATTTEPSSAAPSAAASAEQLEKLLQSRGVLGHKEENVAGGIHLVCAVPNPSNPSTNQIYETTAADYATAVQAVVQQIDAHRP